MAVWPTSAVYIAKYDPNTGYFNDFFDRNDDLFKVAAIQIAEAGTNDPQRDYLGIVEGISGDQTIVFKLYHNGRFELSDGSGFNSVITSDDPLENFTNDQLLTAKAISSLVNFRIAANPAIDLVARTAVADLELSLEAQLQNEVARATAAEAANAASITAERARALAAEGLLQDAINAVPNQIATAIADNDVVDAAARAAVSTAFADADLVLRTDLDAEVARAQAAETTLQDAINAEAAARQAALNGIDLSGIATNATDIADEVARAQAAETALQNSINAIDISGIATNTTAIADESARAQAAETALQNSINSIDISGIATNTTAIADESARALAAESGLQDSIDANTVSINALSGGQDFQQIGTNTANIATNTADIADLDSNFDNLITSAIPASYLLKLDAGDVVITTDGVNVGNNDPDPNDLNAIQQLYAQINNLITQALPASTMFKAIDNDYVVTGFLEGHAGGSLLELVTGDIILPTEPTGFPESSFRLSNDNSEIIFGD